MAVNPQNFYLCPPGEALRQAFVGLKLQDAPAPAAVVDRAVVKRNCQRMLQACEEMKVGFRPHTKSHKTTEVTKLQVGDATKSVKLVVSTLAEAEHLSDFLAEQKEHGKIVNMLYGVPFPPSQAPRLAEVGKRLGPGSIAAMIDHPSQLQAAHTFKEIAGFPLQIFVKVDTGYHHAGLSLDTKDFDRLLEGINTFQSMGLAELVGFYTHAGHSYAGDSETAAMKLLLEELTGLEKAATAAMSMRKVPLSNQLILSVGATPTATSIQNFSTEPPQGRSDLWIGLASNIRETLKRVNENHSVELHAGVYPFLDIQQLATRAGPSKVSLNSFGQPSRNTSADVALTILAEVSGVYENRKPPEALVAAGTLALGREPCKAYAGWGIVSEWGLTGDASAGRSEDGRSGWQLGRIAQEDGILTKDPNAVKNAARLHVGQKVRIWPNHACVAGAMFGWYLVVDSSVPERADEIVDVWGRCARLAHPLGERAVAEDRVNAGDVESRPPDWRFSEGAGVGVPPRSRLRSGRLRLHLSQQCGRPPRAGTQQSGDTWDGDTEELPTTRGLFPAVRRVPGPGRVVAPPPRVEGDLTAHDGGDILRIAGSALACPSAASIPRRWEKAIRGLAAETPGSVGAGVVGKDQS